MCLKLRHAKFKRPSAKETFSKFGFNKGGGRKKSDLAKKTGHISKTVRDRVKVATDH